MTEAFLHYLFDSRKLGQYFKTVDGQELEVVDFGQLNKSSGPDFLEAQTKFDDKRWAGHIEFHLNSSDWDKHGHQHDEAYNNVIAHFVYNHDRDIYIKNFKLPVVELKNQIDKEAFKKYAKWIDHTQWIACENQLPLVPSTVVQEQVETALEQRINRKKEEVQTLIEGHIGDKNKVLFILMSRSLGGKYNAVPMEKLLSLLDLQMLARLNFSISKIQELLLVLAGFSQDVKALTLAKSASLTPMAKIEWKTFGMRPPSQPKARIAQLAALLAKVNELSSLSPNSFHTYLKLEQVSSLSKELQDRLIINAFLPFYAVTSQLDVRSILAELKPEKNKVVKKWQENGLILASAKDSQGLLEQKNEFCNRKKCLFCKIGQDLLQE